MRITGPTVRRRNHAWLQMRSLDRKAARLARRQGGLEEDSADEADVSDDDLDSSGDESTSSLDESDDELDTEPTETAPLLLAPVSTGPRTGAIPAPTARPIGPGLTLGADAGEAGPVEEIESDSDGEETADESTAPSTNTTPAAGGAPQLSTVTSGSSTFTITQFPSSGSSSIVSVPSPTGGSSSSLDELVTSLTGTSISTPPTSTPAPSVPVTGSTQGQADPPNRQANERVGMGVASQGDLGSGQIAGIILGVLTFVGLLVGAAFLWRKRRRDRGLPFFPATIFRLKDDDDDDSRDPSVSGPLPGRVGGPNQGKTNTQIMDDLLKAAYANDNNNMEGAYAPAVPKIPPQLPPQEQEHAVGLGFMDEKAYAALAGPPTPTSPKKPVLRWLDEVRTPTQPNGPAIPPTPDLPASARTSRVVPGGGRVPEPPKQAYYGRDTMTTDTTNTSVRWYG